MENEKLEEIKFMMAKDETLYKSTKRWSQKKVKKMKRPNDF